MFLDRRKQAVERLLLEQGVAAGKQERVPLAMVERVGDRLRLVDADADRLDVAVAAQFLERPIGALHRGAMHLRLLVRAVGVGVDVVDVEDVDVIEAEALDAVLVGAHGAVIAVVEHRLEGQGIGPRVFQRLRSCGGP